MNTVATSTETKRFNWGFLGVIAAAIVASACCVGPLVLLLLGVSGAWISGLSKLEPFRPYFAAFTLGLLGLGFYLVYRKPKEACEPGSACANPTSRKRNKTALWIISVAAVALLASPYVLPSVFAGGGPKIISNSETLTLAVENMTCSGCVTTVRLGLMQLEGVADAEVTLDPPQAVVTYDPSQVTLDALVEATRKVGYPSKVKSADRKSGQ